MALSTFLFTTLLYATIFSFSAATKILPRAAHSDTQTPAFVELHNVIVNPRHDLNIRTVVHPRLNVPAHPVQKRLSSPESSAAAVKRTLLRRAKVATQATATVTDPESAVLTAETMVNAAMTALALLPPRYAVSTEAPATTGATAAYMDANPRATLAVQTARRATLAISAVVMGIVQPMVGSAATMAVPADLSCSEYASGAIGGGATPVSIPSVTTSSFTSGPLPSHSASSISGTSLPPATTEDVTFEYYYTTWTWRYYYYFLTSTTVTTSTYTTTSTVVSVYASASSAAELTFARLSAETTFPTATTAAEVTAAPNPTVQSLNSASTASAVGGATQQRGSVSWGVSNIAACAVAIGIGMVWL